MIFDSIFNTTLYTRFFQTLIALRWYKIIRLYIHISIYVDMPGCKKLKKVCRFCGSKSRLHKASEVLRSSLGMPIKCSNGFICENHLEPGSFEDKGGKRRYVGQRISPDDLSKIGPDLGQGANQKQPTSLTPGRGGQRTSLSPARGGQIVIDFLLIY